MPGRLSIPLIEEFAANLGTIEIEEEDIDEWRQDHMVVFVGVAAVGGGRLTLSEKDGTRKWTAKCKVLSLRAATGDMREELADMFALSSPGDQLHLDLGLQDRPRSPAPAGVDEQTGEITPRATPAPAPPAAAPAIHGRANEPSPDGPRRVLPASGDFFGETPPVDVFRAG